MAFHGFPDAAFTFYDQLVADNTRTFWLDNKPTYQAAVREPMDALLAELADNDAAKTLARMLPLT